MTETVEESTTETVEEFDLNDHHYTISTSVDKDGNSISHVEVEDIEEKK